MGAPKFELKGFLRVTLTDKQKEHGKAGDPYAGFEEYVGKLLMEGYKLSVNWSPDGAVFMATLTAVGLDMSTRGLALSGRGPTVTGALQMLFEKHFNVLKGDWSKASGVEGDTWG